MDDIARIQAILNQHQGKNFVQRIISPDQFPRLDLGGGNYATHKMSWSTVGENKTPVVYPTVVYSPINNSLIQLPPKMALQHAMQMGEYIPFKDPKEADWFSQNYKKVWNKK